MDLSVYEHVFLAALAIQLVFWGYIFRLPSTYTNNKINTTPYPVSIIICAHNAHQHLIDQIPLLENQNYPNFEIIIVNDRSTDNTPELKERHKNIQWITIDTCPTNLNPKKNALAKGIEASTHQHILVTDADCRPASTNWITEMVNQLNTEEGIVLGLSPYYTTQNKIINAITQFDTTYTALQFCSLTLAGHPYMGLGRNMLYHKSHFKNSQLIQKHGNKTGGDDDLLVNAVATKKNTTICTHPSSFCYTFPEITLQKWLQQKRRHLTSGNYYGLKSKLIIGTLNTSHLLTILLLPIHSFYQPLSYIILGGFLLRSSLIFSTFGIVSSTMNGQLSSMKFFLLDMIFPVYLFALGGFAKVFKTTTWK